MDLPGPPEAIGRFFSFPATGPRKPLHEFHSLSQSVLDVSRPGTHAATWTPLAPGIAIAAIPDASRPRRIRPAAVDPDARADTRFLGLDKERNERRLELRPLSQPSIAMRAPIPSSSTAGCSHSSHGDRSRGVAVIEARKPAVADGPVWNYAICRFTDLGLWVVKARKFLPPRSSRSFAPGKIPSTATTCTTNATYLRSKTRRRHEPAEPRTGRLWPVTINAFS